MPPVGFEPTVSAGERPQTNALDRAATGTGILNYVSFLIKNDLHSVIQVPYWIVLDCNTRLDVGNSDNRKS